MTIKTDPPFQFSLKAIQQAWFKLIKAIYTLFVDTGFGKTLFVDGTDGNDDTAQRGSITFKYATIQAALDAALASDVVMVGPGTYAESLTWPETQSLSLIGSGKDSTTIQPAAGDAIAITPTTGALTTAHIEGFALLVVDGTAYGVDANGVAQPTSFTGKLEVYDCSISNVAGTGGIRCVTVNIIDLQNIDMSTEICALEEVGQGRIIHSDFSSLNVDYDPAGTEPSGGRNQLTIRSSTFALVQDNLAWLNIDRDCSVTTPTITLTDDATRFGILRLAGTISGAVSFGYAFVNGTPHPAYDLDYSTAGAYNIEFDDTGDVSTVRCLATARFAMWSEATALTVDDKCDLDIRNGTYPEEIPPTVAGDGTIDRSSWFIDEAQGDLAALHAISAAEFGPPLPAGATEYTITVAEAVIGDLPIDLVTTQTKAVQTFNRTKTADGGAVRYLVTRPD